MVASATHLGPLRLTSLEKPGTVSGTMVLETGKYLPVQIYFTIINIHIYVKDFKFYLAIQKYIEYLDINTH